MALGANRNNILGLVLREAATLLLVGIRGCGELTLAGVGKSADTARRGRAPRGLPRRMSKVQKPAESRLRPRLAALQAELK
jgi:hypothetical protein